MTPFTDQLRDVVRFLVQSPRTWNTVEDVALGTGHRPRDIEWALRELELADVAQTGAWGMWRAGEQAFELVDVQLLDELLARPLHDVVCRLELVPARALVPTGGEPPCAA